MRSDMIFQARLQLYKDIIGARFIYIVNVYKQIVTDSIVQNKSRRFWQPVTKYVKNPNTLLIRGNTTTRKNKANF